MAHLLQILELFGFSEIESKDLLEVMKETQCKVVIEENCSFQQELEFLNDALQSCYLRLPGIERHALPDKFNDPALKEKLIPLLSPFTKEFNEGLDVPHRLLLGASEKTMERRFQIIADYETKGYHSETIYLLSGARDLWIDSEPSTILMLIERLTTEKSILQDQAKDIINLAYQKFILRSEEDLGTKRTNIIKYFSDMGIKWPTEADLIYKMAKSYPQLASTKFILVDAPKKLGYQGKLVRPDTFDTYVQFWQDHGKYIEILSAAKPDKKLSLSIITTQPYAAYQKSSAIAFFHNKPINIFAISDTIQDYSKFNISLALDSFSRCIYVSKDVVKEKLILKNITFMQDL